MATTSARTLKLVSVLSTGAVVNAAHLAAQLSVSERTVRRDIDTLRDLGFQVQPVKGSGGGYRLGNGTRLPPMVFDEEQVVAIAVALQTAPSVLAGIDRSSARALQTVRQVMPERLRIELDAFTVTSVANYWEFPAEPIDAAVVRDVGAAVRRRHVLRAEYGTGTGPGTGTGTGTWTEGEGEGGAVRLRVEPHRVIVWAARWYLVAFDLDLEEWRVLRLDRLTVKAPTYVSFEARPLPAATSEEFVKRSFDRGDTLAAWPCVGSVVLAVPPQSAAEFAPGGAVVERVSETTARLHMGAWSWTGLAGLFVTFAADMTDVQPVQLRNAFGRVRARLQAIGEQKADEAEMAEMAQTAE